MASRARVLVQVLGPVRAFDGDGGDITPPGALQRRLLALLVLRRGRVVSADAAIDALWPTAPPKDPSGALQNHLSRLRRALPVGAIESVGDGYRLDPDHIDVDCDRLSRLLADGAGDADSWAELDAALARWQGPAFVDLEDLDEARIEAARLGELRVRAREAAAEHRLREGELDGLVAELSALCDDEPLRERPRSLLMEALAATGRHVEALRTYDGFRRRLADDIGVLPSPALAAQHAAILDGQEVDRGRRATAPLPVPVTPLIGRERLEEDVADLAEACRLVTLVGPGGVGKTRLLIEVGHRLLRSRPTRPVVLCELATASPASVSALVAGSLGVDLRPGTDPVDQIASVVSGTELVVLLDNCEHVLDPVADLVERLLARCPGLSAVATSRERLRISGEQVCPVPALDIEGEDPAAVLLFLERARAVVPGYEPVGRERATIDEIVRRVDGLPLAIELAAARLLTHTADEVAAGLDHRFSLLTAGPRTSSRHTSLHAAVSWSFELLDDTLQDVFSSIAVFAGSFTAADATAVCELTEVEAATALAELTERSLVHRSPGRRYALLETLRAFGAERLVVTGRADAVGARHARHLVRWVEDADERLLVPGSGAIGEIDAAVPELQLAFRWLLAHGEAELAGRLVAALLDYGLLRLRPDVLAWAESVVACDPQDRSPLAAQVWAGAAYAAWMAGDIGEVGVRSARALAVAERAGGPVPGPVSAIRGNHELFQGRLEEAAQWYRRSVEDARRDDDLAHWQFSGATELLALGYAGVPEVSARAAALLAEVGHQETPYAAYLWYCAGETDLEVDTGRARSRFARALELADRTGASFVTGLAGASSASLEAGSGTLRRPLGTTAA